MDQVLSQESLDLIKEVKNCLIEEVTEFTEILAKYNHQLDHTGTLENARRHDKLIVEHEKIARATEEFEARIEEVPINTTLQKSLSQATTLYEEIERSIGDELESSSETYKEVSVVIRKGKGKINPGVEVGSATVTRRTDPFTLQVISHPVKSLVCNHVFEKTSIEEVLKKRKTVSCPYIGCGIQLMSDNFVEDAEEENGM